MLVASVSYAQQQHDITSLDGWSSWKDNPGFFLEPNRFSVVKELTDRALWLQVGYGATIAQIGRSTPNGNGIQIGMEGLAWSRLQALSGFRFPVETVDYFFGLYATWNDAQVGWKFRISHISSHLVDGADSITGGASSKYSREFVELTRSCPWGGFENLLWTIGLRGYFHQVTKIEPVIAVPACLTWRFASLHPGPRPDFFVPCITDYNFYLFVSSGDGPISTSFAGGFRAERILSGMGSSDLQLYYYYGASWAGTDAGAKVSQLKLQLDVRDF